MVCFVQYEAVPVKSKHIQTSRPFFDSQGYRSEKTERTRDFKTMDIYRNQTKRDGIINMLNTSITTDHTIFPSFGTAEFFEFVVKNPFNHEETVTIEINDPELQYGSLTFYLMIVCFPFSVTWHS